MQKLNNLLIIAFIAIFSINSCTSDRKKLLPNISGRSGEILLLLSKEKWDSEVGDTLRAVLQDDVILLPQSEPMFDINRITPEGFSKLYSVHRNIMRVKINKSIAKNKIVIHRNVWANGQIYIKIEATNNAEFKKLISKNAQKIVKLIHDAELKRKADYFKKYEVYEIRAKVEKKFNVTLHVPKGYEVYDESENFIWIHNETQRLHQGILIYTYNYKDTSDFHKDNLIRVRNYFAKKFVPGDTPNSYMKTEERIPIIEKRFLLDGEFAVEMRGLWNVENDHMGGPFISYTTLDPTHKKVITIEGFVYAGNQKKKNFFWDVEAILSSFKLIKPKLTKEPS